MCYFQLWLVTNISYIYFNLLSWYLPSQISPKIFQNRLPQQLVEMPEKISSSVIRGVFQQITIIKTSFTNNEWNLAKINKLCILITAITIIYKLFYLHSEIELQIIKHNYF